MGYCDKQPVAWIWKFLRWKPKKMLLKNNIPNFIRIKHFSVGAVIFIKKKPIGYITFRDWMINNITCRLVDRLYIDSINRGNKYSILLIKDIANPILMNGGFGLFWTDRLLPIWPICMVCWVIIPIEHNFRNNKSFIRVLNIAYDKILPHHYLVDNLDWKVVSEYWKRNSLIWSNNDSSFALIIVKKNIYQLAWYVGSLHYNDIFSVLPKYAKLILPRYMAPNPFRSIIWDKSYCYAYNNGLLTYYTDFPKKWFLPIL
tara:strand:- start:1203 stop:1976 length:774 start_codon:yes stop_codon:yes gene_type:complete